MTSLVRFVQPMLDFIVAVDDARAWHKENIEKNRSHYSSLACCGAGKQTLVTLRIDTLLAL